MIEWKTTPQRLSNLTATRLPLIPKLHFFIIALLFSCVLSWSTQASAWVSQYKGQGSNDVAWGIAVDSGGNVYVTGYSYGGLETGYDYATIKYDTDGKKLWVDWYMGPGDGGETNAIAVDSSGNVYVTGNSEGPPYYGYSGDDDYATIKYDTNGKRLWVKRYRGPWRATDSAKAIAVDSGGSVYVTGSTGFLEGSTYTWDYLTIKYDTNGN